MTFEQTVTEPGLVRSWEPPKRSMDESSRYIKSKRDVFISQFITKFPKRRKSIRQKTEAKWNSWSFSHFASPPPWLPHDRHQSHNDQLVPAATTRPTHRFSNTRTTTSELTDTISRKWSVPGTSDAKKPIAQKKSRQMRIRKKNL